jgi:flagellar hook-associated protein 1 FlgK
VAAESGGTTAGDLRNERGRRLDELATLIPITVTQREFGAVGVLSAGVSLVDGAESYPLEIRNNGGALGVAVTTQTGTLTDLGGSVGGMLQVLNTDIPGYRGRLDALAEALVSEVNALHQTGRNPDGNTGVDFFAPAGINASSIALSADVVASTGAIAAGTEDTNGSYQSGANDVAIALAGLRNTADPALGAEYGEYLAELVFDVGHDVRSSTSAAEAHTTLANQADIQRQAVSGVSIDEEMIRMIQFQAAYQAAARVVTTADEMIQTLLNM